RGEVGGRRHVESSLFGRTDDGASQGMFAVGLGRGGQGEHFALAALERFDTGDGRFAHGQGARLVEEHGIDRAHRLERQAVLDEHSGAAARSVAMETTSGIARPRAWGQAMTRTVIVRTTAEAGMPSSDQAIAVMTAAPSANQNSHADALSAIR